MQRLVLVGCALVVSVSGYADGDESCWAEDFTWDRCCNSTRYGLVGNPECWDLDYTYLRCCGLSVFPWSPEDAKAWDDLQSEAGAAVEGGEYDFIVVGAGSAGSVAASRLAAAPGPGGRGYRILLLEEGHGSKKREKAPDPDKQPDGATWSDPLKAQWNTPGAGTRTWTYQTGKGLGGTAAVNSMIYTRGSVSEYVDMGWSEEEVVDAFKSLEAEMLAPGFAVNSAYHRPKHSESQIAVPQGLHLSLVSAERNELPSLFQALLRGFEQAKIPFRVDPHGNRSMHGVGGVWRSMGCAHPRCHPTRVSRVAFAHGRPRASPYKVLVEPYARIANHSKVTAEGGITVIPGALVERIRLDEHSRVQGVEVMHSRGDAEKPTRSVYRVAREVVLSAGVFGSPKILTLSGVAEPAELDALGIPVAVPSPEVGRNLLEHVGVSLVASTSLPCPDGYHGSDDAAHTNLGTTRDFIAQLYAFFNVSNNVPGAAGPLDAEIMLLEGCIDGFFSLTFTIMMLQSQTPGRVVMQSKHAGKSPHLDYHPLTHPADLEAMANAIRLLYTEVFTAPELQEFELAVNPPFSVVADFGVLAKWIRGNLYYYSHPVGTCRVERDGAPGVLSSRLQVLGAHGLRVADASVFPRSPSGHSDAPSRLAGELVARFILEDHDTSAGKRRSLGPASRALTGYPGTRLPMRGFGTNGISGREAQQRLRTFLQLGGRLIDTAMLYENHLDVAAAIRESGVPREDVFIISKLPPSKMDSSAAPEAISQIVHELGTYVDMLLLHWPANFTAETDVPKCAEDGFWHRCRTQAWLAMESAHRAGEVRSLGVSNFGVKHLQQLINEPQRSLKIAANEVEMHPWWPQRPLQQYCKEHGIALIAYGSMGSSLIGGAMREAPNVVKVAEASGRTPAQVLLRWAVEKDVTVIPHSSSKRHIAENFDIMSWHLTAEQMSLLNAIPADQLARTYMPDPELAP